MICPWCDQERTTDTDECGGEGEGACGIYGTIVDALREAPAIANIQAWLRQRVDAGDLITADAAPIAEKEIRARLGDLYDLDRPVPTPMSDDAICRAFSAALGGGDLPRAIEDCTRCGAPAHAGDTNEAGECSDCMVADALIAAGLPVRPCGLNANWSVRAWHLGPSSQPNRNDGDLYLLDQEIVRDGEWLFTVVQYDPSAEDRTDIGADAVITLVPTMTIDDVTKIRFVLVPGCDPRMVWP